MYVILFRVPEQKSCHSISAHAFYITFYFNIYVWLMQELTFGILLSFASFVLHAANFSAFCEIIFSLF